MNDDIKEILKWLQNGVDMIPDYACYGIEISDKDCKLLLDYITNLQQELKYQEEAEIEYNEKHTKLMEEYKRLKEENERLKIKCDFLVGKKLAEIDKNAKQIKIKAIEQEDYKSRCEKANEFINENTELEHDGDDYGYMEWINIINMDTMTFINNLSDILNGRSDE